MHAVAAPFAPRFETRESAVVDLLRVRCVEQTFCNFGSLCFYFQRNKDVHFLKTWRWTCGALSRQLMHADKPGKRERRCVQCSQFSRLEVTQSRREHWPRRLLVAFLRVYRSN